MVTALSARSILHINLRLGGAVLLGALAWAFWPSSPEWWGFGLTAIILGVAAATSFVTSLGMLVRLILRDIEMRRFAKQGVAPKGDDMAQAQDLRAAGMID